MAQDDVPHPPQAQGILDAVRQGLEAERAKLADDQIKLMQDKLALREEQEKGKPKWWADWMKPPVVLAILFAAWGGYQTFVGGQSKTTETLASITNRLEALDVRMTRSEQEARQRVIDYVPTIQKTAAAIDLLKQTNEAQDQRLNNVAIALDTVRQTIEALRDTVVRTNEQMMYEKGKRERQGMLTPHDQGQGGVNAGER